MKNYIKYLFSITIAFIAITSCDDRLNLVPLDEIGIDKAFITVEDLTPGVWGVYAEMRGASYSFGESARASDELRLSDENTGQGVQVHNWQYAANDQETDDAWLWLYQAIDRANRLLAASEKFADDPNQNLVEQIKGESYFIRALCHFELLRIYAGNYTPSALGIPYMLASDVAAKPARLNQEDTYANIISDLNQAIDLIPADFVERNRASIYAAKALLARVYLYMGNWQQAITYANDVITNSGVQLATLLNYVDVWDDYNTENSEVIFKITRDPSTGADELGTYFVRHDNEDIFFHPSEDLISQYADDDIRLATFFGVHNGKPVVAKHNGRPDGQKNLVDIKHLRISEMYLIAAEAYAEREELGLAAQYIQDLRDERITAPGIVAYGNKEQALTDIRLERRRELAYDGHRFYDLRRWGLGIVRTGIDAELSSSDVLPANDPKFVFPIPQWEIFANENMEPNPGYDSN